MSNTIFYFIIKSQNELPRRRAAGYQLIFLFSRRERRGIKPKEFKWMLLKKNLCVLYYELFSIFYFDSKPYNKQGAAFSAQPLVHGTLEIFVVGQFED
jgi:hypothetical protein